MPSGMERGLSFLAFLGFPLVGVCHLAIPQGLTQTGGALDVSLPSPVLHKSATTTICVQSGHCRRRWWRIQETKRHSGGVWQRKFGGMQVLGAVGKGGWVYRQGGQCVGLIETNHSHYCFNPPLVVEQISRNTISIWTSSRRGQYWVFVRWCYY